MILYTHTLVAHSQNPSLAPHRQVMKKSPPIPLSYSTELEK